MPDSGKWDYISSLNHTSEYRDREFEPISNYSHICQCTAVITRNTIISSHKSIAKYLGSANRPEVIVCVENCHGSLKLNWKGNPVQNIWSTKLYVCMWSRENILRWIIGLFVSGFWEDRFWNNFLRGRSSIRRPNVFKASKACSIQGHKKLSWITHCWT